MRSVTSSFNRTVYLKNITRNWPLWAVYSFICLVQGPIPVLIKTPYPGYSLQELITTHLWNFADGHSSFSFIPIGFAILAAMAVFQYLYTSRSACMMHALPVSRKSLYLSSYLSGLTMLVVPAVVAAGLTFSASICRGIFLPVPIAVWLLQELTAIIFFFSLASFLAMLTGNILALPAFFAIANVLVVGIGLLLYPIFDTYLYGFAGYGDRVEDVAQWLTPFSRLADNNPIIEVPLRDGNGTLLGVSDYAVQHLETYAIYLVVALVLAFLAYQIYLYRETERAGDIVAVHALYPIFRYGVGLCGGLAMGSLCSAILGLYNVGIALLVLTFIWGIFAYFAAEMLLQKSFKVIKKSFKGACVFGLAMIAFFLCVRFDVIGYSKQMPDVSQIESVSIYGGGSYNSFSGTYEDEETIALILAAHEQAIHAGQYTSDDDDDDTSRGWLRVTYSMADYSSFKRYYQSIPLVRADVNTPDTPTYAMSALANSDIVRRESLDIDLPEDIEFTNVVLDGIWDVENENLTTLEAKNEDGAAIYAAIFRDFDAGNIGLIDLFKPGATRLFASIELRGTVDGKFSHMGYIDLVASATETIDTLTQLGYLNDNFRLVTSEEVEQLEAQAFD